MDTKSRKYTRRNARTRIADLLREALQLVDKHCVASGTTLMPKTPLTHLTSKTKLTPVVERAEEYTPLPNSTTLQTSSSEDFPEPPPVTPIPNITPMNSFATPLANISTPASPAPSPATPKTSARKYNPKWNEFVKQYMKEQKDLGRELKRPEALFEIKELGLYESNKRTTRKTRATPGRVSPPISVLNPERV